MLVHMVNGHDLDSFDLRACWRAHSRKCRACSTVAISCAAIVQTIRFWFVWLPAIIASASVSTTSVETGVQVEPPEDVESVFGTLYTPFFASLYSTVEDLIQDPSIFVVMCAQPTQWLAPSMVCVANGSHVGTPIHVAVDRAELPTLCRVDLGQRPCVMHVRAGTTDRDVLSGNTTRLQGVSGTLKQPCHLRLTNVNATAAGLTLGPRFPSSECPGADLAVSSTVESVSVQARAVRNTHDAPGERTLRPAVFL